MPAILVNTDSEYAKELAKHEQHQTIYTMGGLRPGNPYVYRRWPAMMYKAQQIPGNGKWAVSQPPPSNFGFHDMAEWDRACQSAAHFTTSCQMTVGSEDEHK